MYFSAQWLRWALWWLFFFSSSLSLNYTSMRGWGKWGQRGCGWNIKLITGKAWLATRRSSTSHEENNFAFRHCWVKITPFLIVFFISLLLEDFVLSQVEQPWGLCILHKHWFNWKMHCCFRQSRLWLLLFHFIFHFFVLKKLTFWRLTTANKQHDCCKKKSLQFLLF